MRVCEAIKLFAKEKFEDAFNIALALSMISHGSSKVTKNESSRPDKIPLQMLPMGIWGPENMKIENI